MSPQNERVPPLNLISDIVPNHYRVPRGQPHADRRVRLSSPLGRQLRGASYDTHFWLQQIQAATQLSLEVLRIPVREQKFTEGPVGVIVLDTRPFKTCLINRTVFTAAPLLDG